MGDRVDLLFDNLASSLPLYKTQRLRIVAVGSLQRIAAAAISVSITDGSFSSD
jgi:tripartite-type tricarboxylate transporter receptor subunit TctC